MMFQGSRPVAAIAAFVLLATPALAHSVHNEVRPSTPDLLNNGAYDFSGYEAQVAAIVDAETLTLNVHVWPGQILSLDVRPDGIESPDDGAWSCDQQREFSTAARGALRRTFPVGTWVYLDGVVIDDGTAYGDVLRWDETRFQSVAEVLLDRPAQWAIQSDGTGTPFDWCWGQE